MFMSFQFTGAQSRYHTTEREALAVVKITRRSEVADQRLKVPDHALHGPPGKPMQAQ